MGRLTPRDILASYRVSFAAGFLAVIVAAALIGQIVPRAISARKINTADSTTKVPAPTQSPSPCCGSDDDKPHLLVGSYYSLKDQLTAKLLLNNKGPQPLAAYPTLYSMSGERFDVGPVTVDPESFRMIDIREWVSSAGPQFQEGSVQVFHLRRDLVLGAQVYLADEGHSLSFDEKLVETKTFKSSRLEGLWWLPTQRGAVRLTLSNTSDSPVTVTINVNGHAPQRMGYETVQLLSHETRLLDIQDDVMHHDRGAMSRFGGISVEHSGPSGSVIARAMAQHAASGYSLAIQFSGPAAGKSSKVQGVGLRLGNVGGETLTPLAIVRNVGNVTTTVTGRLRYSTENGNSTAVSLPDLRLSPGEIEVVDISRSLRQHGNEHVSGVGGLEFAYSTQPGSVTITALSLSDGGNQVFRVPMWDIYALRSSTGGYPWYIDGNSSTVVYIKNGENHTQQYFLHVRYPSSIYVIGSKRIEPGQTIAYDLRQLRDNQVPDNQGRVIPPYANSGQVHWSKVGPEAGVLIGRSEQADTQSGISSNYACLNCCNDNPDATTFRVSPNSASAAVGDSVTFSATVEMMNCYTGGNDAPIVVDDVIWSSTNPDVAVVGAGVALAQAPGTANIKAEWHTNRYLLLPPSGGGGFGPPPVGGGGECEAVSVTYNATPATFRVFEVKILQDATDITGTTQNVIIGQRIDLVMQVLPENDLASQIQWAVPETRVRNYVVTYTNPTSPTSATVTPLTNLGDGTVSFYWINGGDGRQVTLSCVVNERQVTRTATFNVKVPTVQASTSTGSVGITSSFGFLEVAFGASGSPGISFSRSINVPQGFSGQTAWVNVVNPSSRQIVDSMGTHTKNQVGLDSRFPYSINDPDAESTNDTPGEQLLSSYSSVSIDDKFEMWIMFRPSGQDSIWVPLKKVSWSWSASVTQSGGNWSLGSNAHSQNPAFQDTTAFPVWTKNNNTNQFN